MNTTFKLPFYIRASILILGMYAFISMLCIARDVIVPILYAIIIAILISPAVNFLERKKINRTLAIAGVLSLFFLVFCLFIGLILLQASKLQESFPQLAEKFQALLHEAVLWASHFFNIKVYNINLWVKDTKADLLDNSNAAIGFTLKTVGGILSTALLTPVYTFLLLLYKPHLIQFIYKVFGTSNEVKVKEILSETKTIIQSYLVGLFVEFVILSILNSMGLLLLGIDYAILLGILGAILNIIPYLGGIIGVALFMVVALVTKSPEYMLYTIVLYTLIQLIDNNYIVPKIVGSKVKLNALVSIIIVIIGAALWGIPGMFLAIPLTASIKLILDRIDALKPWGFLLGDYMPSLLTLRPIFKKIRNKPS